MKKISLRWRMTLMSLIIVIITCVSMKIAICSSGTAQITELGDYVLDFTAGYSEEKVSDTSEYIRQFEEQFTEELAMIRSHFCMYNWLITGTVIIISGLVVFFVSRRSLEPLKRFSGQLGEIRMENIADMRIKEDNVAEFALLSRSLNDMLDRISHAFEAQHQFTANAAHELRTPLSLMQSQMDLYVEENQDVSEKTAETIAMIREQTERLSDMVRILLDMSELQTVPCSDTISLGPMIEEVIADLSSMAEEENITLEQSGESADIKGSDILIYRVFFNLVENAIKYNKKGGKVSVETSLHAGKVRIYISDTGYGIPDEFRNNIFQPFFRIDKSQNRSLGGVGLGLSLVWEIINLHGGKVEVMESSERGTVILLEFSSI